MLLMHAEKRLQSTNGRILKLKDKILNMATVDAHYDLAWRFGVHLVRGYDAVYAGCIQVPTY